jgi:two-component system NtrC family sensor kinase
VVVDEEMLDEVFTNLLTNAIEAMPKGGKLTLETSCDPERNEAIFHISDTGKGILPKHRAQLFKPFFSTKKEDGGTGLGLAISNRIIADHGGTIAVETHRSGANRGTTFAIRLPVKGPHLATPSSPSLKGAPEDHDKQDKNVRSPEVPSYSTVAHH